MSLVARHVAPIAPILLILSALVGCGGDDPATPPTNEPVIREDNNRPGDPTQNNRLPYDMGAPDLSATPDMATPPVDLGGGEVDMGGVADMTPTCGPAECSAGETRCEGEQVRLCEQDANGCVVFGPPTVCPQFGDTCQGTSCMPPSNGCTDNDFDGYGPGCPAGDDCDDSDPDVNPARQEVCDGKDNNCDNQVDNVSGAGGACTSGQGACEASGTLSCDAASGQLVCDATPGTGAAETCDGVDNDCDGQIDNGGVCPTPACGQDNQEPNDTLGAPFSLPVGQRVSGRTCSGDTEFFKLTGLTSGTRYRVHLTFPTSLSDLDMRLFKDGTLVDDSLTSSDHEAIEFVASAGAEYTVEVVNYDQQDNFYLLQVITKASMQCAGDDEFENNNDINTATPLPSGWRTDAYMCGSASSKDWYYLGNLTAGTRVTVDLWFTTRCVGFLCFDEEGDIDAKLWAPNAPMSTTVNAVVTGDDYGDDEYFTYTVVHDGPHFLEVYSGDLEWNDYQVYWSKSP